jgi:hypothetical protein
MLVKSGFNWIRNRLPTVVAVAEAAALALDSAVCRAITMRNNDSLNST